MRTHDRLATLALTAAIATAAASCGDRPIGWERERSVIGPIPLKDRVAYVDSARDRVIVVETDAEDPDVYGYRIGRRAIHAAPAPDREHLVVVTRGEEAIREGQVDEEPRLWYVDATDRGAEPVGYAIGSPFDRVAIASRPAEGRGPVAVAYFSSAGPTSGGVFRNPNELAVIDLGEAPGAGNPTLKTIRSFGSVPEGVILSPPMRVPGSGSGERRTFAFVLGQGNVTVIDTANPSRNEVSIRLDGTGTDVMPREMVFEPSTGTAYLRSDGARDVLEVDLLHDPPRADDGDDNDYRPALAELGAGGGPADIEVYDSGAGDRYVLAATPATREVVLIDADTGGFTAVDTPDPIDRVLLFPQGGDATPRVALLASLGARVPRVHLLSLDQITDDLAPVDLRTVRVEEPVLDVVPVPGRELGMIVHDDDRTVLGLLDVGVGSVAPLQGVGRLDSYDFAAGGTHLVGAAAGASRVGLLDLDNLHPSDVRLDAPPREVFAMPGGSIFIDHGTPFGLATVVPRAGAPRDEARVVEGFLFANVLDQDFHTLDPEE